MLNDKIASQLTIGKPFGDKFVEITEAPVTNNRERSLRNTFGWTRIDILTMLMVGIFLAAFCFSILVESVQMLVHINHQDTMHLPVAVFTLSVAGLILNVFCYLLIGGYTHHQENFLHIKATGDVVLDRDEMRRGSRRLSFKSKPSVDNHGPNNIITTHSNQSIRTEKEAAVAEMRDIQSPSQVVSLQHKRILRKILRDTSSKFA